LFYREPSGRVNVPLKTGARIVVASCCKVNKLPVIRSDRIEDGAKSYAVAGRKERVEFFTEDLFRYLP